MTLKFSVNQTLAYAKFFNFPLTFNELHFWLIGPRLIPRSKLKQNLKFKNIKPCLKKYLLTKHNPYRTKRFDVSQKKLHLARKTTLFLRCFPTIKLVAVTGSLAVNNALSSDDIDLMIVTSNNTLWLTRLFVLLLLSIFFKRRLPKHTMSKYVNKRSNAICLNLWLDTTALQVPKSKQNLYTAHEVLQIKPLLNRNQTYEKFISSNAWTNKYLANAYEKISSQMTAFPNSKVFISQISIFAKSNLREILNLIAFRLQYYYMKHKITSETISRHSAYFHPRDLSKNISKYLLKT